MSSPEDIEKIKAAFAQADRGGGGKITRDALKQVFRALEPSDWSDEDLQDLFDLFDKDKDGYLRYDWFVNSIMQDDGTDGDADSDGDDGDADRMGGEVDLGDVELDLGERLLLPDFIKLAKLLGEDEDDATHIYERNKSALVAQGDGCEDGVPVGEFLDEFQIEMEDLDELKNLHAQMEKVRAGVEEETGSAAVDTGLDKILFCLTDQARPLTDAWKLVQEGNVPLTRAARTAMEKMKDAELMSQLKTYDANPSMLPANAGQSGDKELCIAKVDAIIKQCKASGTKFTDPEWDVTKDPKAVLYVDKQKPGYDCTVGKPAGYKRLPEIVAAQCNGAFPDLYRAGIKAGDIVQGQIGTCFLLGAIGAVVSNNPNIVKKIFIHHDMEVGVYGIRMNLDGEFYHVIIDDYFPVDQYGRLLYASSKDKEEVWIALLEKAFCKLHTCYEMCDGGRPSEAIASFFGGASGKFVITKKHHADPKQYFQVLSHARARGWLLTTCFRPPKAGALKAGKCGEAVLPTGLVGGHVYSILRVVEAGGNLLVKCRNPWGSGEWTGKWSDKNEQGEWTPEMVQATGKSFADDGTFWMSIEDFVQTSTGVEYARVFGPAWKKISHYRRFDAAGDLKATAQWAYAAADANELGFAAGEQIEVEAINKGWWLGKTAKSTKPGYFPGNYVKLNDRPCALFELTVAPNAGSTMTVTVILLQPCTYRRRRFYKRKEDGMNYKDTSYPSVSLIALDPKGGLLFKREGKRRSFHGDINISAPGKYKIYAFSVDGTGEDFTVRAYLKDGTATMTEGEAKISEIAHLIT
eukprot:TRINITY_DN82084_c0_g1_i1.p1 TRINITY_DN82084_c0_g1~~TRINITY_DN82084_c0_g1_i1.p1  ORF type:complete len:804 (+),score=217.73 TRINITY_DN82084_c0_g1_i1:69-2480(+)